MRPRAPRKRRVLLAALALFAAVFALRFAARNPIDGVTFLYVIPVIMLGVEFGRRAGAAAGLAALLGFSVWALADDPEVGPIAYLTRGTVFIGVGWLTGMMSARLRTAEERFRRAFEDSPAGMALVGVAGEDENRIVEVNEALVALSGRAREDLVGRRSLSELTHPDDVERVAAGMRRLLAGEVASFRAEFRMLGGDGEPRWVDLTTSVVADSRGRPLYRISQLQDVDARRRAEEQLRWLADYDTVSGLYNRRRFREDLERELALGARRSGRGAVLVIDLDRFKQVNDSLGHAAGDAVIARVGGALLQRLRSGDVAARLGGDEFGVILRRVTAEEACRVARELLAHVQSALAEERDGAAAEVTLSIGVAHFDGQGPHDADALLDRADKAMYRAKAGGGAAAVSAS